MSTSLLSVAFRVAELRQYDHDPKVRAVLDAADKWLDEWEAFGALPWYQQLWLTLRRQSPRYVSPLAEGRGIESRRE